MNMLEITSSDDESTFNLEGKNWFTGAVFFQRLFAVLVFFRCKNKGQ